MADHTGVPPAEAMRKVFSGLPIVDSGPEREQFWPGSAMAVWQGHADAVLALIRKKDGQYGGAWAKQGYMGNFARILSKAARVENLVWRDGGEWHSGHQSEQDNETLLDTLYDLSALCAMAIANIEEGNRWGK